MKRFAILVLGMAAIGLSGCGIRGDLERPPPVWGPDQRSPAEREHEQDEIVEEAGDVPGAAQAGPQR